MSKVKKILAVVLSMAMVLSMSLTAFAANAKPAATDTAKASVTGVTETGVTVTAYKIVEANYNDQGFTGYSYVAATGLTKAVFANGTMSLTDADIVGLTSKTGSLASTPMTKDGDAYSATLAAGSYMVLVTGSGTTVYNPMLVSVGYKADASGDSNELQTGAVNADTNWGLTTVDAYAKSSEPTVSKTIVGSGSGNDHGDDVAIGTAVPFEINTKLPSYSAQYTDPEFVVTDTLSAGLTAPAVADITVAAGTAVRDTDYTVAVANNVITVEFTSAFISANQNLAVKINYSATLNDNAKYNFDPNTNDVSIKYSNDPTDATSMTEKTDKTYSYTFAINAALNGESTETWNKITNELLKTGEEREIQNEQGQTVTTTSLPGATFTLTNTATNKVYTATSDNNGGLSFKGLDAGTYSLVETQAPTGYTLNSTPIPVVISATYNENGTLNSYTIIVAGEATSTYTATYKTSTTAAPEIDTVTGDSSEYEIKNTKLSALPSTGGIGTTIFTIGGVIIMIGAAFLFFRSRKKEA